MIFAHTHINSSHTQMKQTHKNANLETNYHFTFKRKKIVMKIFIFPTTKLNSTKERNGKKRSGREREKLFLKTQSQKMINKKRKTFPEFYSFWRISLKKVFIFVSYINSYYYYYFSTKSDYKIRLHYHHCCCCCLKCKSAYLLLKEK